jgi:Mg2+/citrate symporter
MYEVILIILFIIGIFGLFFLLCFPVYLLIKEERRYQKQKQEYYDETIKILKDTIKLYDAMIEQEKKKRGEEDA